MNPNKDFNLTSADPSSGNVPTETISAVACGHWASPQGPVAVVGCASWDGNGYVWMMSQPQPNSQPAVQGPVKVSHGVPVLDCCFSTNGQMFITASVDGTAKVMDCASSQQTIVGRHALQTAAGEKMQPIRFVRAFNANGQNILATASWDMTVQFWNLDAPNPAAPMGKIDEATIGERVYAFDIVYPRCVIGTAANQIIVYDLASMRVVEQLQSPLSHQMRTISIFSDAQGFAVGSVEGRVGIQYFQDKAKNFAFRCHREVPPNRNSESLVYPVNCISFNKKYNTFSTAGSDGIFNFWDKDTKQCLKRFEKCPQTISAAAFQQTNDPQTMPIYVYTISYDWHKGPEAQFAKPGDRHTIWLHLCQDAEIKPKPGGRR